MLQPREFALGLKAFEKWALESGVDSFDEKQAGDCFATFISEKHSQQARLWHAP